MPLSRAYFSWSFMLGSALNPNSACVHHFATFFVVVYDIKEPAIDESVWSLRRYARFRISWATQTIAQKAAG